MAGILIPALIATFMLQAGLSTDPRLLRAELEQPGRLALDVLFFMVLEPILAVLVVWVFHPDAPATVALILLSVVGVAPIAARGAGKGSGDVALALVLTIVLGIVTVFTAVPLARWLLHYEGDVTFQPAGLLLKLILLQVVPLALGLGLRALQGKPVALLARAVRALNLALFLVVVGLVLVPQLGKLASLGARGAAAGLVFAAVAAVLGVVVGGGPGKREGRAMASLANTPNVGLALAIVTAAGGTPLVTAAVLAMFILRVLVSAVVQRLLVLQLRHTEAHA